MSDLPKIEEMLERQARLWAMRRKLTESSRLSPGSGGSELREGPWITISRQLGSDGSELARRLGHDLGWQVFDREILGSIADHTHTREAVLRHLDEQAIGPINDYLSQLLDPSIPGRTEFQKEMARVIWGLARQGSAIIVGRGANCMLDAGCGLRIRTVAPLETRVKRVCKTDSVDRATAEARIRLNDERQRAFIRQAFDRDIADAVNYDLLLNLGALDLDSAVQIVLAALRSKLAEADVPEVALPASNATAERT